MTGTMTKKKDGYTLDPRNARRHPEPNKKAVEASLRELGAGRSIVVDADGVVIGGNAVYEQAQKLGLPVREIETSGEELVVVRRVDLKTDDPRRKALALADNQTGILAEWDDGVLEKLLGELGDFDPGAFGFDLPATGEPAEDPGAQIDKAAELLEKWGVERGQVWEVGRHRVMCGDSTDAVDVAFLLAGAEPHLMVTDPPYGVEYDPTWRDECGGEFGDGKTVQRGIVANDDRSDWSDVFSSWPANVLYAWSPGGDHIIATGQAVLAAGFEIRGQIIWRKSHFVLSRGAYHWQHEPCWYAVRKGAKANWIGDRTQSTVWDIAGMNPAGGGHEEKTGHGTQKPLECMARPIHNHEGDVADPFLGSGTTVVASEQLGRICYGMEIEPKYVAVTLERCAGMGLEPKLAGDWHGR